MKLRVILDTHIKYDVENFISNKQIHCKILEKLTFSNPKKKFAEREMLRNAKCIPDKIYLWKWENPEINSNIVLPRGFLSELEVITKKYGIDSVYTDKRILHKYELQCPHVKLINLRGYQTKAIEELVRNRGGIYKAPTGSGKTRVMLELVRTLQQKTIVICEKIDILSQWEEAAFQLGFEDVGTIGRGTWFEVPGLVFALRQSLVRRNDLHQRWYDQWGMVIVDECHHQSSETMYELVQRFPAYYRFGCSATPDKDLDTWPITRAVLGPVVHESTREEIGDNLITPSVKVIKTDFEFDYRPTFKDEKGKIYRNNYNAMISNIESNYERNLQIMWKTVREASDGHHCLIVSKRKRHLDEIYNLLPEDIINDNEITVFNLTGDNSNEASEISYRIECCLEGSILFSTLADEGTDIPRLDRLFLVYPGRKLRGYQQSIGRIMRPHSKKVDAIVYDFRDIKVPLLNSQFRDRAQMYHKNGYEFEIEICNGEK